MNDLWYNMSMKNPELIQNGENEVVAMREQAEKLFYNKENPYMKENVRFLLEKHPEAMKEILETSKGFEDISDWLVERTVRLGEENGIVMIPDPYIPSKLVSLEGIKKNKLDAPDPFDDIAEYEKFMEKEKNRTGYEGIPQEKMGKVLEMQMQYMDADNYYRAGRAYGREMVLKNTIFFQNEENGFNNPFTKAAHAFDMTVMKLRLDIEMKIAKLKYSKEFIGDKADRVINEMKKNLQELFKEEE